MSFYPSKPWTVNYFANLADAMGGVTRLMLTPAQFKSSSPDSLTGVLRTFASLDFRLYYSRDLSQAALAAPPSLAQVAADDVGGGNILFRVYATDPLADVQAVWVTYTGINRPLAGLWRSLDLQQDSREPALWTGRLSLGTIPVGDLRYMVQAVNGVGLVTLATNNGEYFTPGVDPGNPAPQPALNPTTLTLLAPPSTSAYGSTVTVKAALQSLGAPLPGQSVEFGLEMQTLRATTDAAGEAAVKFLLMGKPGATPLKATFAGAGTFAPAAAILTFCPDQTGHNARLEPGQPHGPVWR